MCVVSMIGDWGKDKITSPTYPWPTSIPTVTYITEITRAEFSELVKKIDKTNSELQSLRNDILEIKQLLLRAKIYDEENNEPNCEMEDKVELLKRVAEMVGVDLNDVFVEK